MVITAAVEPGENLLGYVLRVSNANGIAGSRALLARTQHKGTHTVLTRCADLRLLSALTGQSVEALKTASYVVDADPNQMAIGTFSLQAHWINIEKPRVCPLCLKERIVTPKLWDLKTYVACHKHGVLLIDRCPSCHRFLNWHRPAVDRCSCGQQYSEAVPTVASVGQLGVSGAQADVLVGASCEASPTAHFPTLVSIAWHFGRRAPANAAHLSIVGKPPLADAANVIEASSKVVLHWPKGFYEWLSREELEATEHHGIGASFGSTLDTLRRLYDHPEGQFILAEVREYLAQQWQGGRVLGHSVFHVKLDQPRFLTVAEIAEKAGVAFGTVAKAIHDGVIEATVKNAFGRKIFLITAEAVEEYCANLKDTLERAEVADFLGVNLNAVKRLRKASLLVSNSSRGFIKKGDLEALMERLEALAVSRSPVDGLPLIHQGPLGSLTQLLQAVIEGRITLFLTFPQRKGMRKFSLERAEVKELTRDPLLSLNEASHELGIRAESLRAYTVAQLISSAGQSQGRPLYDRQDLISFRREYRLSRDIAKILGTAPSWARLKMESLGIASLVPGKDRAVSGVWRATDVPDFGPGRHFKTPRYKRGEYKSGSARSGAA